MKLLAQGVEVAPSARVKEQDTVSGAPDGDPVSVKERGQRLRIKIGAGISARDDFDGDLRVVG